MTKQTANTRPVNIKQEPSVDALADTIARLIRAMEQGTKIKRTTIKRERNEGDPCGIDGGLMKIISVAK